MAHEINTPLGNGLISLTGARDLIQEKLEHDLSLSSSDLNLLLGYLEYGVGSLNRLGLLTERFKEIGQNVDGTAVTIDVLNSLQDILGFLVRNFREKV